jgi:single-stranded-DNA-specific exonuclease
MNLSSINGKKWIFKKFDHNETINFAEKYSLSVTVAKLLSIRKKNINNLDLFLNPKIKNHLPNPFILKDMDLATKRTYEAILNNDKIGIFGDYDVDGATSTAILAKYFISINCEILTYIPDRQKEGYGPSAIGFKKLINKGVKIIFTVDCGTLSYEAIQYANDEKVDVIVLDHHQSEVNLPKALAIVNPNRYDDKSGLEYLCAAGVCFIFLIALNKMLRDNNWFVNKKTIEPNILNFLDLVSLGTVCDVVPLVGLNRAIVKQGLKIMKKRSNLGLKTLYDLCKIESEPTTYDLGFKLGPRINAGGRVGKSSHGAELLISNDPQKAFQLAIDLDKSNLERRSIESIMSEQINNEVKKFHNHPVLVISGKSWHEGVIGIVAARIKDKYQKPTILISLNENIGKGSARSVIGFDIGSEVIKAVQNKILEKGGGHKMAAGFTIKEENISFFRDTLIKNYLKKSVNTVENSYLYLDSIISPSSLNLSFYNEVNFLAPYGSGNNEPKFLIEDLKVISSNIVGENHIKAVLLGKDGNTFKTFTWNAKNTPLETYLNTNSKKKINIVGKMKLNEWRGEKKVEFIIEDISVN